jgi:predicted metal-binding membrane protein
MLHKKGALGLTVLLFAASLLSWYAGMALGNSVGLVSFLIAWTFMMVAIMTPSFVPTALLFQTISRSRSNSANLKVHNLAFVLGYFAIWALSGLFAFLVQLGSQSGGSSSLGLGLGLLVAGVYQLSPFKNQCLQQCRSPMEFFMQFWKDGALGAVWLGVRHGAYCIGCCWGFMIALIVLGMMNPVWMLAFAGLIAVEKHLAAGSQVARVAGVALVVFAAYYLLGGSAPVMEMEGM